MDDVIKLVKTYRLTEGIAERLALADEIFRLMEPDLRFFVFAANRICRPLVTKREPPQAQPEIIEESSKFRNGLVDLFPDWNQDDLNCEREEPYEH